MLKGFFRDRIFTYYFLVIIFFTTIVVIFQYNREKKFRQARFETTLDNVVSTANNFLRVNRTDTLNDYTILDSLIAIIPVKDLRLTIIDTSGLVLFDSFVEDYKNMENHSDRPELIAAIKGLTGSSVRTSSTTGKEYFYYAHRFNNEIIRAAAEYNYEVRSFLKIDKLFFLVVLLLFLLVWTALVLVYIRFKRGTSKLREFVSMAHGSEELDKLEFPKNELGFVGKQIIDIYEELRSKSYRLETEQQKIFRHLHTMEEGIAIFNSDSELVLSNEAFLKNINLIASKQINSPGEALTVKALKPVKKYLAKALFNPVLDLIEKKNFTELVISKQNRYFLVRCNTYNDNSFEIIIKDITKSEKNKVLKQELTSNIAHELRTPVTSIVGYLETVLSIPEPAEDQKKTFLERARAQAERLAELINHISIINRLEENPHFYQHEEINVVEVIDEVLGSMHMKLDQKSIAVKVNIDAKLNITSNRPLLHSIFQNLLENTINYAGENLEVNISKYYEDDLFYYFRYSNTGNSIPEKHLNRLFERFYRIDEGRARNRGGSGLGLAIVKHAVLFHKGQITVKNLENGGVEFQFTISRKL